MHLDSDRSAVLSRQALEAALANGDTRAEGWARLAQGFHQLYFATPAEASAELRRAHHEIVMPRT